MVLENGAHNQALCPVVCAIFKHQKINISFNTLIPVVDHALIQEGFEVLELALVGEGAGHDGLRE